MVVVEEFSSVPLVFVRIVIGIMMASVRESVIVPRWEEKEEDERRRRRRRRRGREVSFSATRVLSKGASNRLVIHTVTLISVPPNPH